MDHAGLHDFRHDNPQFRTVLTEDSGGVIRDEMTAAGLARAMIVCSTREAGSVQTKQIAAALGDLRAGTFDGVRSHPTLADAERGADLARRLKADCLIAIGGGGSSDQAKGIALWLADDGDLRPISASNTGRRPPFTGAGSLPALPIIAVPTTASGAELTPGFGQKDVAGQKLLFRDARVFVRLIVLDPQAIASTPPAILVPTCMNAIAHCVEALYSLGRDPISRVYAVSGFGLLMDGLHLLAARGDEAEAHRKVLVGANLAGRAIVNARTGIHHGICHVLGAAGVPHGVANSIMLPHVIRFNEAAAGSALDELCGVLGVSGIPGLARAISAMSAEFRIPARLRDVGVARDRISDLVARCLLEPGLRFNPRQDVTAEEVEELLGQVW
jgi:alcohol dehydrogenase class IV